MKRSWHTAGLNLTLALSFALSATISAGFSPAEARTLGSCKPISSSYDDQQTATQICVRGLDSTSMDAAYKMQQTPVWCWAASMEMILAYNREDVSQRDIVRSIFGEAIPVTLDTRHIGEYLNRTYTDSATGRSATVSSVSLYHAGQPRSLATLDVIIDKLRTGHPLLLLTRTHAMVMTAIYYYADAGGNPTDVAGVIVRDPYPYAALGERVPGIPIAGHPGERVLSTREYQSQVFVFSVSVS